MHKPKRLLALMLAASCFSIASAAVVDVVVVVDESGSMSTEHAWLPGMISALDSRLSVAGHTGRYGLVGFGSSANVLGHQLVGGGTAAQFGAAALGLVTNGGSEDGYSGLDFAFTNYGFQNGSVRNFILVTDEDRDNLNNALTFHSTLAALTRQKALLNAVVNNSFSCAAGSALGRTTTSGFQADAGGGFTPCANPATGSPNANIAEQYVDLALATGGAAWNLNVLRSGGNDAASFTNAFVDIKIQEIQEQTVPEPSTYAITGFALVALGFVRRRCCRSTDVKL